MAWLMGSEEEVGVTAAEHDSFVPSYEARVEARAHLQGLAGSGWLFELERPVDTSKETGDEPRQFK